MPGRRSMRSTRRGGPSPRRSEEHTSELQSQSNLVCRLLLEKKKKKNVEHTTHRPHKRVAHNYDHTIIFQKYIQRAHYPPDSPVNTLFLPTISRIAAHQTAIT